MTENNVPQMPAQADLTVSHEKIFAEPTGF